MTAVLSCGLYDHQRYRAFESWGQIGGYGRVEGMTRDSQHAAYFLNAHVY